MSFEFRNQLAPELEESLQNFYLTLSEKDRRRFAAIQAQQLGHGAMEYLAGVLGCSRRTIERGKQELSQLPDDPASGRIRKVGGGRKKDH